MISLEKNWITECKACQLIKNEFKPEEYTICEKCGHLYMKSSVCFCDHYRCYICDKIISQDSIISNDLKIAELDEEINLKIIDKLNLIDCTTKKNITSYNGIVAVCSTCIRKALTDLFIEKFGDKVCIGESTIARLIDNKFVVIGTHEKILSINGKNITEEFLKYKFEI
ncbi:MAG: hypothetical protein GF317_09835 [Candidatus Lokiarchaeota archaeon]|nr:hypothetical protein [Candidatus Lokiarchaeota archaeon]